MVAALLAACSRAESPMTSERCQRLIEADAAARAQWEQTQGSGDTQDLISGLRRAFEEAHQALLESGCLTS
jgi:DNA-binding SARP family transcriptional activator